MVVVMTIILIITAVMVRMLKIRKSNNSHQSSPHLGSGLHVPDVSMALDRCWCSGLAHCTVTTRLWGDYKCVGVRRLPTNVITPHIFQDFPVRGPEGLFLRRHVDCAFEPALRRCLCLAWR